MEQRIPAHYEPSIRDAVHQLVVGNYGQLIADGRANGWREEDLRDAVARIVASQGALVDLPDAAFAGHVALPLDDGGWGVDIRLWTVNGISSYTLVLDIGEESDGFIVHIDDIEVK